MMSPEQRILLELGPLEHVMINGHDVWRHADGTCMVVRAEKPRALLDLATALKLVQA